MSKTNIAVIGPNLYDQSKGAFHAHTAECRDGKNGRKYPLSERMEVEVASRDEATLFLFDCIVDEYVADGYTEEGAIADLQQDIYFHACLSGLPVHDAEEA